MPPFIATIYDEGVHLIKSEDILVNPDTGQANKNRVGCEILPQLKVL